MDKFKHFITSRRFLSVVAAVAVIAAVSIAFFYPDAFEGNVLQQHDMQQGEANGRELADWREQTGSDAWWTNSLFGGMPAFQISPSYGSSALFSWITKAFGLFLPAPANLLAMMMLGMFILLMAMKMRPGLALTGALAWGLSSYFVIIIGAGHIWKFVTLAYVPPTIAGLVLIYNGRRLLGAALAALFMMMQIASNHVQMSYYFAWVMAAMVIAYGVMALRQKQLGRWGVSTAVLAGAMLLAVAANAPNLYHTYEYSKQTMRGGHSELTPTDPAALANATAGLDRDYITMYSYGRGETMTLLIPDAAGGASAKPANGGLVPLTLADTPEGRELMQRDPQMTLLQLFSQYFGGVEGTNGPVYVGAIIVALFLFGAIVVKGPMKWALVVMTLLSILLAWGRNLQWFTDLFIDYMPMYSKFRTVESILVIAEFTMPLLALMGLREFFAAADRKRFFKPLLVSFGLCALCCLAALASPGLFATTLLSDGDMLAVQQYKAAGALPADFNIAQYPAVLQAAESLRDAAVKTDAMRSLAFLAVGLALLFFAARGRLKTSWAVALLAVAVGIDLYTADKRWLNSASFVEPQAAVPFVASAADKAILADPDPDYRVLDATRFQSAAPSYFHKSVGGYHAAKLTRYQDLIDRHLAYVGRPEVADLLALREDSVAAAAYSPDDMRWLNSHLNVLDMLNTRYVIVDHAAAPVVNPRAAGNAWFVDRIAYVDGADAEMAALDSINPRAMAVADRRFAPVLGNPEPASPGDVIALTSYAPDRLTYKATTARGALAVFSEVYFPWGWQATVDGKPVELGRVDYILRALPVAAGTHEIVMEFRPRSIRITETMAYVAVGLIYLLLIVGIVAVLRPKKAK